MIMRLRHANIRLINRRSNLPRLLLALSSINGKSKSNDKNNPTDAQGLTGHSISDIYVMLGLCHPTLDAKTTTRRGWGTVLVVPLSKAKS
jgi:hypothetical protein